MRVCGDLQTSRLEELGDPRHITTFIKQQEQTAIGLTKGRYPEAGLTSFCSSMDGLLSMSASHMNTIHYSAITTAAAHIWTGAQRSPGFRAQADVRERLKTLFQRCLQSLQALLADMESRDISSVLWSSATLNFNPDDAVPGIVQALTSEFLQLIVVEQEKQRPNAHDVANTIWAFATMGHPATAQVVRAICLHFGRIVRSPVAQPRPTAQAVANLLRAMSTLNHTPFDDRLLSHFCRYMHTLLRNQDERFHPDAQNCANVLTAVAKMSHSSAAATKMVDSICLHFERLVGSPVAQQRPNAQHVANLVWALGVLKHTPPDDRLLDGLCEYMRSLVSSHDQRARPTAQATANTLWALAQLKHVPSPDVVTAMYDHLVVLCQDPCLQPGAQDISNCFIACAELRLHVKPAYVEALLEHFMEMGIQMCGIKRTAMLLGV